MREYFILAFCFFLAISAPVYALDCREHILSKNTEGEMLQTLSGDIFEALPGDSITAYLWLPMSELLVCGPNFFDYKGKKYEIYEITNIDDDEKISALSINGSGNSTQTSGDCYDSAITNPTPFMGTNDEVFVLLDGSVWQIKYEYEYMYEYYPNVVACPDAGYIIVEGKKLNARVLQ